MHLSRGFFILLACKLFEMEREVGVLPCAAPGEIQPGDGYDATAEPGEARCESSCCKAKNRLGSAMIRRTVIRLALVVLSAALTQCASLTEELTAYAGLPEGTSKTERSPSPEDASSASVETRDVATGGIFREPPPPASGALEPGTEGAPFVTALALDSDSERDNEKTHDPQPTLTLAVAGPRQSRKKPELASFSGSGEPSEEPESFTQEGLGTWYNIKTNRGTKTASGIPLCDNKLTAAHRNLPFGTRVKVTNLRNGNTEVVTVTDRGPFIEGRIIDVSIKAARSLDMVQQGVVSVVIEVVPEVEETEI
jgi:3D (Asp-Asp-Asp) domain-containing protein